MSWRFATLSIPFFAFITLLYLMRSVGSVFVVSRGLMTERLGYPHCEEETG
jgi:hypothetical protein